MTMANERLLAKVAKLQPGTCVSVKRDNGETQLTRVKYAPWQLGHGQWVVGLEGISGACVIQRVRLADGGIRDEQRTPRDFFDALNAKYSFTLDAAATKENALCPQFFTKETDGLKQSWAGHRVFVNPPYSQISFWIEKCLIERELALIVALLPNWTDRKWYAPLEREMNVHIDFLPGRLKFSEADGGPEWGSMLVYFL